MQPNWLHLPVAYHGRSSSIIVSGVDVRPALRPEQTRWRPSPIYGPSQALDFELEMAASSGRERLGQPIPIAKPRAICSAW